MGGDGKNFAAMRGAPNIPKGAEFVSGMARR